MDERCAFVRHCTSSDMDINLCYQTFGTATDPAVILVGGLNMQSYAWDEGFCEALVLRGFYVIRFDNRDIGHSTKIEFSSALGSEAHTTVANAMTSSAPPGDGAPSSVTDSTFAVHTSASAGSSSGGGAVLLQRSTTPGDSESSSSSSCVVRVGGGNVSGIPSATKAHRSSSFSQHHHHHQVNLNGLSSSSRVSSEDREATHRLISPNTKRGGGGGGGRGGKLGKMFWWCSRDVGLECLSESAHFLKDCTVAAVKSTLCMTGLMTAATNGAASRGGAGIVRPRAPKIVPWKLMLPQALSCGEVLPYTLEDMALDALALLDVLGVRRAHVFGISMGGMISQHMALLAPERVLTLTCIMSSTNAQDLPHPAWWVKLWMLRKPASNVNREQLVEFRMKALQGLLYGCVPVDEDYLKKRITMSLNRSSYADGLLRQAAAIMRAPSRDAELTRVIRCPCLVIHGQNDVLCRVEHGYRLAKVLTNSKFVVFKNMGHYLNPAYFDAIVGEFLALTERGAMFEAQEGERRARHLCNVNRVSRRYEDVV